MRTRLPRGSGVTCVHEARCREGVVRAPSLTHRGDAVQEALIELVSGEA